MLEVIPARTLNTLCIYLDIAFWLFYLLFYFLPGGEWPVL